MKIFNIKIVFQFFLLPLVAGSSFVLAKEKAEVSPACKEVKNLDSPSARVWGALIGCPEITLSAQDTLLHDQLLAISKSLNNGLIAAPTLSPHEFYELHRARESIYFEATARERARLFNLTDQIAMLQLKKGFRQTEPLTSFVAKYLMCSTPSDVEGMAGMLEVEMDRDPLLTLTTLEKTLNELKKSPNGALCAPLDESLKAGTYARNVLTFLQYQWVVPVRPSKKKKSSLQAAIQTLPKDAEFRLGVERLIRESQQ